MQKRKPSLSLSLPLSPSTSCRSVCIPSIRPILGLLELNCLQENASPFDIAQASNIIEQFQQCHLDHPIGKFFGKM
ncbi:uncharacterized protein LOC110624478 isoform X3 [Manihot esculenta]|uniref:uncharacterized protein LOC110624478 isoform X3 n=1 Tax=Manihot esculenta TaxID=3983 RepID=UPI000B5D4D06|nr:uncharacterized protein LOC110624478 isoform X3 [Manihot esculenta]